MRIILLNFPIDNNYGGMLQRYALVTILQNMGHDVLHLNLRFNFNRGNLLYRIKRDTRRLVNMIISQERGPLFAEIGAQIKYEKGCLNDFYDKYIPHTRRIYQHSEIGKYCQKAEVLMVGSDQVWRRSMSGPFPYSTMFFDFAKERTDLKRIAYGVSFGRNYDELSQEDIDIVSPLFALFDSVSVRERFDIELLNKYSWNSPSAEVVLDPVLLLTRDDYLKLIEKAHTKSVKNCIFCYILDNSVEKQTKIDTVVRERNLEQVYCNLDLLGKKRVEQFLRCVYDSEMVVTDSYHGVVFSILFNKPFIFLRNERRGNDRYDFLISLLNIDEDHLDWNDINEKVAVMRKRSLSFLSDSLR